MLIKILIAVAIVVVIFVVVVAMRPSTFLVTRSAVIAAPPSVVFDHINDLHKWQEWSPWARLDPNAKIAYTGPAAGVGASFSWAGDNKIGEGSMTSIESRPNDLVRYKLEFKKPFEGTNEAEFVLKPEGNQTSVTWSMSGSQNFMFKAVGLFMNCDKMIGGQFEEGLANLQKVVAAKQ